MNEEYDEGEDVRRWEKKRKKRTEKKNWTKMIGTTMYFSR